MKSKKFIKIATTSLALTGLVAVPIVLTSCSKNENNPIDPNTPDTSDYYWGINPQYYSNGNGDYSFENKTDFSMSIASESDVPISANFVPEEGYDLPFGFAISFSPVNNGNAFFDQHAFFRNHGILITDFDQFFVINISIDKNIYENGNVVAKPCYSNDMEWSGIQLGYQDSQSLLNQNLRFTFRVVDKKGCLATQNNAETPDKAGAVLTKTFSITFTA